MSCLRYVHYTIHSGALYSQSRDNRSGLATLPSPRKTLITRRRILRQRTLKSPSESDRRCRASYKDVAPNGVVLLLPLQTPSARLLVCTLCVIALNPQGKYHRHAFSVHWAHFFQFPTTTVKVSASGGVWGSASRKRDHEMGFTIP